jgi:tetratricopeptide (TPR) repeat protein
MTSESCGMTSESSGMTSEPSAAQSNHRLAFTLVMLAIPFLFFGMTEGLLRLSGFGDSYPLFVPVQTKPEFLYQNRDVARRYFTHIENVPSSLTDFFEAEKDSSTYRIFVQGGSSGAGFPYYYGGAFSRMLEQRLIQTFPDRHIEVVNTSMAAVNSYTLLDLVDEILEQKPDAVLIYAGHNEYYGALGVGSSESLGRFPWLVRSYLALADLRIVQALRSGLAWVTSLTRETSSGDVPSGNLMQRMIGNQTIPYGSPEYHSGLRQFRSNLSRILTRYRQHDVPVLIGTLASNERDHEPFSTGFAPNTDEIAWQAAYDAGLEAARQGDAARALAQLDRAIEIDSLNADAFYARGRMLENVGRFDDARRDYIAAKDRDELRFRASEDINDIIKEEAARHRAHVVDIRLALSDASPNGIIGSNAMVEHLHPNVEGYFLIADAYYEALRERKLIGDWSTSIPKHTARSEILLTPVDSLVGVFRIYQLMAGWPFQPPGVTASWADSIDTADPVAKIALALVQDEINWQEANESLLRYFEQTGDYHRALQAALARIQEYPFVSSPYLAAGNILMKQRRYDEALVYFTEGNDVEETAAGHRMIGSILLQRGDRSVALPHLERAVAMDPRDLPALYNLSGAYALEAEFDKARQTVRRLLELEPDHRDGRRLLASLPAS